MKEVHVTENITESLTTNILDYIKGRKSDKLEQNEKEIAKLLQSANESDQAKLEKLQQKHREDIEKFKPENWLTEAANKCEKIDFVTHAIKFIHGSAKGTSINSLNFKGVNREDIISTASIVNPHFDVVCDAKLLGISKLLTGVSFNGKTLTDYILKDDISPLLSIAKSEELAQQWFNGFKQVFSASELSTHKFGKQVYWPVEGNYHLLTPLFATSFAQVVYEYRSDLREIQFSKEDSVKAMGLSVLPNLAVQTYGGTKPQNISQLNSQRGGKNYLLDSRPPTWKSTEKLPLNTDSVFNKLFTQQGYKRVKQLQVYLESILNKKSTVDIREYRRAGIDDLVDILLLFAAHIHQQAAGWSLDETCKLTLDEQLWLDPKRAEFDNEFADEMDKKEWHEKIANKFATWVNSRLESKKLAMGQTEHRQWVVLAAQELRLTEQARKEFY